MNSRLWLAMPVLAFAFVGGCQSEGEHDLELAAAPPIKVQTPKFSAEAGITADVDLTPANNPVELAKKKNVAVRRDAFSMLSQEVAFDREQRTESLLANAGSYSTYFTPPVEVVEEGPVMEPLPAWRLSGVVIGDGIAALLDMGSGKVIDIRPGMKIPDTEWTVVSIDSEHAVLKRPGNRLPRTFVVNLQGPNPGEGGGGGGGGNNGGGGNSDAPAKKKGPLGAAG